MNPALLSLLQLTDPALPIGGFAHSSGLETYVQERIVHDAVTARQFITGMLTRSLRFTDAAFASLAFDAAADNNIDHILQLDAECTAAKLPRQTREASQKLGRRLLKLFEGFVPGAVLEVYVNALRSKMTAGNYPVVFGIYAFSLGIQKEEALQGFYYNAAAAMITNAVKLVPLGQQEGQAMLFSLQETIRRLAIETMDPDRAMLGLCCAAFDIRCMQHEHLYSRLYMS